MSAVVDVDADRWRVVGPGPVRGRVRVPGDKSISHRGLLVGALAPGTSRVSGRSDGDDVARTESAVVALGATVDGDRIEGGHLGEPDDVVDLGNSGTAIRLLAGVCARLDGVCVLTGDASIRRRPMGRVTGPLQTMGARIDGRDGARLAPLVVRGGSLRGGRHELEVASAQVKSAILLAAMGADEATVVAQRRATRAHTEELLTLAGARVTVSEDGRQVRVEPGPLTPFELDVPGDPSAAAFWAVAAAIVPGGDVTVQDVYRGPVRLGFCDVLARMGAVIDHDASGDLRVAGDGLRATGVTADEVPGLVDEIPVLAVAAAVADGTTTFDGVGELRHKESDRIATTVELVRRFGAQVTVDGDRLAVTGTAGRPLSPAVIDGAGDHRIAMAAAVAALAAEGTSTVQRTAAVATSYPGFVAHLERLTS